MNIIVFGAAGGIGRHVIKHALTKEYQVTAYVRDKDKLNISDKNLRIVEGEISDYDSVGYSIYRKCKSRIRRCENELCHFP